MFEITLQIMKQLAFGKFNMKPQAPFGGALLKNSNAKSKRPLSFKKSIHLVMRSSQARGKWSFLRGENFNIVNRIVYKSANRFGVKVQEYANVGNHIHILLRVKNRYAFQHFIRVVTGNIAMTISGSKKGEGLAKKFWDSKPFTRVVEGFRGYTIAKDYVAKNTLEGLGILPRLKDETG
jgi:REP element-mobilizing transposase RayT